VRRWIARYQTIAGRYQRLRDESLRVSQRSDATKTVANVTSARAEPLHFDDAARDARQGAVPVEQ
jgi:hypothetical protein